MRLSRGIYVKAPRVEVSKKISFVEEESFLKDLFGQPRPMIGRDITTNHFGEFASLLNKEDIPVPSSSESFITDSITPPFSDKLMMYHNLLMCGYAISVDGVGILIENGWMEQSPQAVRHEKLLVV